MTRIFKRVLMEAACCTTLVLSFPHPSIPEAPASPKISSERRQSFNDEWRFFKGEAEGAEAPNYDDSQWRSLRLPHDWAIEGPFDRKMNPHTGALPIFGTGWYRKSFALPAGLKGRRIGIEFDGAMSNSQVWINGHLLGGRPYGYIGFQFDLTPYLKFDDRANILAVRLTPEDHSSRWYPGAGIYRNVWLVTTGPVHVAHWGTYVTTPNVDKDQATVAFRTDVENDSDQEISFTLRSSIQDGQGKIVGRSSAPLTIAPGKTNTVSASIAVKKPKLWDIDRPNLYTLVSEVWDRGQAVDRSTTPFGIRTIAFDKERGFLLNGRHVKLHGVCNHHDLGALGTAVNRRATERQLEILRAAGVNAIRTSHNPPSPELLELTDRMGFLVMDEAFDMWRIPKVPNGYSKFYDAWSERDVRDMVHRDGNHPSIILWSIGNEIPEQGSADGAAEAHRLTGFFHQEDPTRPTTSAFNNWSGAIKNKLANEVDIPGFNYQPARYEQILKEHPTWTIVGSETESCVSSRGVYHLPVESYSKHPSLQLSSYDIIAPPWAYCPDVEFSYQDKLPQVLGEFVWTGFDYIGEPTPFFWRGPSMALSEADWPARSSYFGMVDLAGFPKDRYYMYQSQWTTKPMVHLLPHWNWDGKEGQAIPVMAYSNAEEVELFLNGKSLGKKAKFSDSWEMTVSKNADPSGKFVTRYRRIWQVPYQPGILRAVAYDKGKQVAADEVQTAGPAARVKLFADRTAIEIGGDDLSFITVRIEDKDGNLCPMADNQVAFDVTGAGEIAAVDNGNAATEEPFQARERKAFNGLALLIVRSKAVAGTIHISATSSGLAGDGIEISAGRASALPKASGSR
ncbi:MAG TPA: beta-galactosidase GalB [Candidatus Angelobacter sp.]|nr:beta-galactosidase GalB [Candidatus Angelobacter sp.]